MNKRTAFITAAAVTGVMLAGTAAVGANIGILNAADSDNVGELSAAVTVSAEADTSPNSAEPQVIDVYLDEPLVTADPAAAPLVIEPAVVSPESVTQQFDVDDAGTVNVKTTKTGVLLDGVVAADGWSWSSEQPSATELVVTFASADSDYIFYANLALDGTIMARVDEPIVKVVQAATPSPSQTPAATPPAAQPPASQTPVATPPATPQPTSGYVDDDHEADEAGEADEVEYEHEDEVDEHDGGEDDD
jgi:hypothetical protein